MKNPTAQDTLLSLIESNKEREKGRERKRESLIERLHEIVTNNLNDDDFRERQKLLSKTKRVSYKKVSAHKSKINYTLSNSRFLLIQGRGNMHLDSEKTYTRLV